MKVFIIIALFTMSLIAISLCSPNQQKEAKLLRSFSRMDNASHDSKVESVKPRMKKDYAATNKKRFGQRRKFRIRKKKYETVSRNGQQRKAAKTNRKRIRVKKRKSSKNGEASPTVMKQHQSMRQLHADQGNLTDRLRVTRNPRLKKHRAQKKFTIRKVMAKKSHARRRVYSKRRTKSGATVSSKSEKLPASMDSMQSDQAISFSVNDRNSAIKNNENRRSGKAKRKKIGFRKKANTLANDQNTKPVSQETVFTNEQKAIIRKELRDKLPKKKGQKLKALPYKSSPKPENDLHEPELKLQYQRDLLKYAEEMSYKLDPKFEAELKSESSPHISQPKLAQAEPDKPKTKLAALPFKLPPSLKPEPESSPKVETGLEKLLEKTEPKLEPEPKLQKITKSKTKLEALAALILEPKPKLPDKSSPQLAGLPYKPPPVLEKLPYKPPPVLEKLPYKPPPVLEKLPYKPPPVLEKLPYKPPPVLEKLPYKPPPVLEKLPPKPPPKLEPEPNMPDNLPSKLDKDLPQKSPPKFEPKLDLADNNRMQDVADGESLI